MLSINVQHLMDHARWSVLPLTLLVARPVRVRVSIWVSMIVVGSGVVNRCPKFDKSCKVECAAIDAMGCLTCLCPSKYMGQHDRGRW